MASYTYNGDHPVSMPEFSLMNIQPGQVVVAPAINHPDFTIV